MKRHIWSFVAFAENETLYGLLFCFHGMQNFADEVRFYF